MCFIFIYIISSFQKVGGDKNTIKLLFAKDTSEVDHCEISITYAYHAYRAYSVYWFFMKTRYTRYATYSYTIFKFRYTKPKTI